MTHHCSSPWLKSSLILCFPFICHLSLPLYLPIFCQSTIVQLKIKALKIPKKCFKQYQQHNRVVVLYLSWKALVIKRQSPFNGSLMYVSCVIFFIVYYPVWTEIERVIRALCHLPGKPGQGDWRRASSSWPLGLWPCIVPHNTDPQTRWYTSHYPTHTAHIPYHYTHTQTHPTM